MSKIITFVKIGQIINTHGNRGELKIYPLTDDINRFCELDHVFIRSGEDYREYRVNRARIHRDTVIISFGEIKDMNEAEKLKGRYLELPVKELKPLPPGHYYIFELVGLAVYEGDILLGEVTDVLKTGSNDVYVVKASGGNKQILIPAIKEVVKSIDLKSGTIKVILPPGLLD